MSPRHHKTQGNNEEKVRCLLLLHKVLTETYCGAAVYVVIPSML